MSYRSAMAAFLKVEFSAETAEQADDLLNALLARKLVTGGQVYNAPARFLWKGAINDLDYFVAWSFTVEANKSAIADVVKSITIEEVPMIWFTPIDGNPELLDWIAQTVESAVATKSS